MQVRKVPGMQNTASTWDENLRGHCAQEVRVPLLLPEPWDQSALELGLGRGLWELNLVAA